MLFFGRPNIKKLERMRDVQGLIKVLCYKKDGHIRGAAAQALGRIGDWYAIDPLLIALQDESATVRKEVAEALGRIGDWHAIDPLLIALQDADEPVHTAAIVALIKIDLSERDRRRSYITSWESGRVTMMYESEISAVTEALRKIKDSHTTRSLITHLFVALQDTDVSMRKGAADILGEIGDPCAVNPLLAILQDTDEDVRRAAEIALKRIGYP